MATNSNIEWTDATWNPTTGCRKVSPGCLNCYAERMSHRLRRMGRPEYQDATNGQGRFTGRVATLLDRLSEPLCWRKPRRVFVNSMSDLFHKDVPFEFIAKVFGVMSLAPQHTFQILTKRSERMLEWFKWIKTQWEQLGVEYEDGSRDANIVLQFLADADIGQSVSWEYFPQPWPLPNVWLGVSTEDQERADERIPNLLRCKAAVRFLSCEPLLGPLDLRRYLHHAPCPEHPSEGTKAASFGCMGCSDRLQWVIAGGESGPNARPMHPDWIKSIRDQCVAARVPFFFKQWGNHFPADQRSYANASASEAINKLAPAFGCREPSHYPIGKKLAGRLLDGREWNEFPQTEAVA